MAEELKSIGDLLKNRVQRKPNHRMHSPIHALVDEICQYFGERKAFGMYLGVAMRLGEPRTRAIFSYVKDSNAKSPRKLFMYMASRKYEKLKGGDNSV